MGLLKSAPDVQVFAPTTWFVGQTAVIEIEVVAKEETKVDFIDVRGTGKQGWKVGSGKHQVIERAEFPRLEARVMDEGVLPAGSSRFRAKFELPHGCPPSHDLDPAWARFEVYVHVSIPWWIDGRYRFNVPVRVPPPPRVERTPYAVRSEDDANKPRLELSLASTRLIVGETLVGSCAVFHVDDRKPRDLDIELVPSMRLIRGKRVRDRRAATYNIRVPLPAGSAGTTVPFQFRLPEAMTPTFKTITHELDWHLVASYGSFFGGKEQVSVPLHIVDASAAATTARLHVAPRLADQRVIDAFDRFAQAAGWVTAPTEGEVTEDVSPYIERAHAGCDLGIGYSYRGKDGTFLVARLGHPSLGLALAVTPSSSLRHVFFRDIEIDVAAWDRAHLVAARSAEQSIPFLKVAAPAALATIRDVGPLLRWDDDGVVFERAIVSVDDRELDRIARALAALASSVSGARDRIATPPGLEVDVAAMQELAKKWRGSFNPGDVSIEGVLDNAPIDLALQWDEETRPYSIRVSLGSPNDASELARQLSFSMPRPAADALAANTPEALVSPLTAWPADFRDLHVHDGVVSASLVLDKPHVDAARVRELVEALRTVLVAIDPASSPYR
jgi:hypothetical protein